MRLGTPSKAKEQAKASLDDLTPDQREALVTFATKNGKRWKDHCVFPARLPDFVRAA